MKKLEDVIDIKDWKIEILDLSTILFAFLLFAFKERPDIFSMENKTNAEFAQEIRVIFRTFLLGFLKAQKEKAFPFFKKNVVFTK